MHGWYCNECIREWTAGVGVRADKVIAFDTFSGVVKLNGCATGSTPVTVIATVAGSDVPFASVAV